MPRSNLSVADIRKIGFQGIPVAAIALALDHEGNFNPGDQRTYLRYVVDSMLQTGRQSQTVKFGIVPTGHTGHFGGRNLDEYETVSRHAINTVTAWTREPALMVAGISGNTDIALQKAEIARDAGYDVGMISMGALRGQTEDQMIEHCRRITQVIPGFGFMLQPACGGIHLGPKFWAGFSSLPGACGIKVAGFSNYWTNMIMQSVYGAGNHDKIPFYTGNDCSMMEDLLLPRQFEKDGPLVRITSALLGHFAVLTGPSIKWFNLCREYAANGAAIPVEVLAQIQQANILNHALFDPLHLTAPFTGCIAMVKWILHMRYGIFGSLNCWPEPNGVMPELQSYQVEQLEALEIALPHLFDYDWVAGNIDRWRA